MCNARDQSFGSCATLVRCVRRDSDRWAVLFFVHLLNLVRIRSARYKRIFLLACLPSTFTYRCHFSMHAIWYHVWVHYLLVLSRLNWKYVLSAVTQDKEWGVFVNIMALPLLIVVVKQSAGCPFPLCIGRWHDCSVAVKSTLFSLASPQTVACFWFILCKARHVETDT